jgi:hypothetical protein
MQHRLHVVDNDKFRLSSGKFGRTMFIFGYSRLEMYAQHNNSCLIASRKARRGNKLHWAQNICFILHQSISSEQVQEGVSLQFGVRLSLFVSSRFWE